MKLGISSYTYTWAIGVPGYMLSHPMGVLDLLHKAVELEVDVVQFADNLPLHTCGEAGLQALVHAAKANEIQVEVGTRGVEVEHLREYLRIAQLCESPFVRVVVDTAEHHPSPVEVVKNVRRVMPEFENGNVELAIENHDRFSSTKLISILEQVDSPNIRICLDTVNSFGSLEGPEVVVERLGPWTVNLHVKDFIIRRADHAMGFTVEGSPRGEGMLNVPWLLSKLRKFDRDCNAIIELWTPPQATMAETIALEDSWAAQSVQYMRGLLPRHD